MKNTLFASTAVAALLVAGASVAAEKPTASVGGYMFLGLVFGEPAVNGGSAAGDNIGVLRDGEIHFNVKGSSDNGLTFDGRVELEAFTTGDQIDENWGRVSGSFGAVKIGSDDSASYNQAVGIIYAPGGRVGYYDQFSYVAGGLGNNPISDQVGIHYTTPNFSGFEAAISYIPEGTADGGADTQVSFNDGVGIDNVISVGASYSGDFEGFSFGVSGGYDTADGLADDIWSVGLTAGASGFTVGVHYLDSAATGQIAGGVQYKTGPWTVAGGYATTLDLAMDVSSASAWVTYAISAGVTGTVGVEYGGPDGSEEFAGIGYLALSF